MRMVAQSIAEELSTARVLFDEYHEEELSHPRGGLTLLDWYERESLLVVVALSEDYDRADNWTHLEWPQVLTLISKRQESQAVLLLRMDKVMPSEISGLSEVAFAFDARRRSAAEVADAIRTRLRRLEAAEFSEPAPPKPLPGVPRGAIYRSLIVPAELPSDIIGFAGRSRELQRLQQLISNGGALVVYGPAGVGKSAFVTHAAHSMVEGYSGGQLYINLQGATPGVDPVEPIDALGRCLRSLGMNGDDVPHDPDEASARYRSLVAGRRLLVVLDNAASEDQVRPLIAVGRGSSTLITSRTSLGSLDGAQRLHLDALPASDALDLLASWIGRERMDAEPGEPEKLVGLCDCLPLALRIIGARLAARPHWSLETTAALLDDEQKRLGELQVGDLGVRASLQVSYSSLRSPEYDQHPETVSRTAEIFMLLGLLDAPVLSLDAIAALADASPDVARNALERLVDDRLLESLSIHQYRIHDLVRLFARERAMAECTTGQREEAVGRALDYFLQMAEEASSLIQDTDPRRKYSAHNEPPRLANREEAIQWMERERTNLVAVFRKTAGESHRHDVTLARSADAIFWFCHFRCYPHDLAAVSALAAEAAARLGDLTAQAQNLHNLCIAYLRLHENANALDAGRKALALRRSLNDQYGECRTLDALGRVFRASGDAKEAVQHSLSSLALARSIGDRYSESNVLCNLVDAYLDMGLPKKAIQCGEESVAVRAQLGDGYGVSRMRVSLGSAYEASGRYSEAIDAYAKSLAAFERLGDRHNQARCLFRLGVAHLTNRDFDVAEDYLRRACTECHGMGDAWGAAQAQATLDRFVGKPVD